MTTFEIAYNTFSQKMDGKLIKPENIMIYVKYAMEIVELTNLKGAEQKQMVIDIIRKIVKDSCLNDRICLDFIESGTLSQTIDIIVDATKGNLAINKPIPLIKRVLVCCLPFLNRQSTAA